MILKRLHVLVLISLAIFLIPAPSVPQDGAQSATQSPAPPATIGTPQNSDENVARALDRVERTLREIAPKPDIEQEARKEARETKDLAAQEAMAYWAGSMFWLGAASLILADWDFSALPYLGLYTRGS